MHTIRQPDWFFYINFHNLHSIILLNCPLVILLLLLLALLLFLILCSLLLLLTFIIGGDCSTSFIHRINVKDLSLGAWLNTHKLAIRDTRSLCGLFFGRAKHYLNSCGPFRTKLTSVLRRNTVSGKVAPMHAERALWNRLFTAMFWRNAGTSVILAPLLLTSAMAPPVPLSAILAFVFVLTPLFAFPFLLSCRLTPFLCSLLARSLRTYS
mmetsp:Transcript_38327/g.86210  ORF Transcript_38327/g.86210 Transcript_38327/m.86210 type:complete len:210 (-) Transcript_38327:164-793(-)